MFKKENLNMMRTLLHQQKHKNSQPFNINSMDKYERMKGLSLV